MWLYLESLGYKYLVVIAIATGYSACNVWWHMGLISQLTWKGKNAFLHVLFMSLLIGSCVKHDVQGRQTKECLLSTPGALGGAQN